MSATDTPDDPGVDAATELVAVEDAYRAVGDALEALSLVDQFDHYVALQRRYFDLKAAVLARSPEFQRVDLPGTNVHVPSSLSARENERAEGAHGVFEVPGRVTNFRVLDGLAVADPDNPHTTRGVTVDHVIDLDGSVSVEVDGKPLDQLVNGGDC